MKILVVSQYYPPENALIAPTVAHYLAEKGHQVRVLTGYPNYPEGRLFEGFTQHWRVRKSEGSVDVLRVPLLVDHSTTAIRRILNYLSFALTSATARGFARDVDVIYVYATQMTPALGPWLWRLTGGAPYVLHVQDLWPDSITGSSIASRRGTAAVEATLAPWLRSTYRHAAAVIGIAPTMVSTLIERGAPRERTHLIYNWASERVRPSVSDSRGLTPEPGAHVVYAGNVGDMQDLETAVRAAHLAQASGVRLTIVGDGVALPKIRDLSAELGATNVHFQGRLPREQMGTIYGAADFALVTLKDLPTFRGTIPSKFQAALSHGVPVITTVQGDLRRIVEELGIGFTAETESVESLAGAFRAAATQSQRDRLEMSERADAAYAKEFSLASGMSAIEEVLIAAAQKGPRRRWLPYDARGDC